MMFLILKKVEIRHSHNILRATTSINKCKKQRKQEGPEGPGSLT